MAFLLGSGTAGCAASAEALECAALTSAPKSRKAQVVCAVVKAKDFFEDLANWRTKLGLLYFHVWHGGHQLKMKRNKTHDQVGHSACLCVCISDPRESVSCSFQLISEYRSVTLGLTSKC